MTRKYKMVTIYYIWVNDRCFQRTEKEERKDDLLNLLPDMFPGAEVWCEEKRERRYI